jgi:transcription-repair coupling factor (superfamily II helicase)
LPWRETGEVRIDLPLDAYIPKDYIADENLRIEAYRRISDAREEDDIKEVQAELADRYGSPLPSSIEALFDVVRLRALMADRGIVEAATVAGNLRVRPIELTDSKEIRLQRILPTAQWRPETRTLLVPEQQLPKTDVVRWVTDILQQLTSPA